MADFELTREMANLNTFAPQFQTGPAKPNAQPISAGGRAVVVGAGAFGGWSALYLLRAGFQVTLIDAWGAGNSRSSSGDETRVIRSTYGANEFYFDLNVRSLELWKENQSAFGKTLYYNKRVLWFCYQENTPLVDDSIPFAHRHGMDYEYLSPAELQKRFPIVNTADLHHAWLDPHGGFLKARESMIAVQDAFCAEGGKYIQQRAMPGSIRSGKMDGVQLADGSRAEADVYLFACGSWLGQVFPDVLGKVITCTQQEVFYFGTPPGNPSYEDFPVWIDADGQDYYYGIPGNARRGFKIGVDKRGDTFDPTDSDRIGNPKVLAEARKFLTHRFPGMRHAPVAESRVCPYENSPDGNFLFDTHPEADNLWFLGGGSGHGFKHGPALGELVSKAMGGKCPVPGILRLRDSAR